MKQRLTLFFVSLFLFVGTALAQTKVTGTVLSQEDGQPIIGAAVKVVGTSTGMLTDVNGRFTVAMPEGKDQLEVSYLGYQSKTVKAKANMRVFLKTDAQVVDEVVVTGYGSQRKASFTGAASKVDGAVVEKKSDANFVKALEGTITGVQMNNSSSMPGTWGSVYVRGRASLNSGTQPLYVIDGVPVNSDYDTMSSSSNNAMDPMASINPTDIESVTVLKDAAATAIYGARAGNGVIVITTKKGAKGRHNVNVDIKQGFTAMANNNMKFANAEQTMSLYADGYVARYGGTKDARIADLTAMYEWDGKTSTDWMDEISRKGYYQDYNINISGQTGETNYYVSAGYLDTKGIIIASDFKRYSGRINVDSKFKMFKFGANLSYAYSVKNGFSQSTGGSFTNATVGAISSMQPFYPVYNEDGTYSNVDSYNPFAVWDKELGDINEDKTTTLSASPYLQVDFGKGIYFKSTFGANIYGLRQYQYWSAVYNPQGKDYNGLGQQYNSNTTTLTWTNTLGWDYTINEKHNIDLLFGQEMQRRNFWYEYYSGNDFPFADSGMRDFSTCANIDSGEYFKSERRLASYFANAQYS